MNCPVCNRNNAVTLSVCPSCGAMINDSVREELMPKIVSGAKSLKITSIENVPAPVKTPVIDIPPTAPPKIPAAANVAAVAVKPMPSIKTTTTELAAKPLNSTLVEFHSKNAAVPEWRLQLQNAVRQRQDKQSANDDAPAATQTRLVTSGANALKAEIVVEPEVIRHKNPTLNKALDRIEKSRGLYLEKEEIAAPSVVAPPKTGKNYRFSIAPKTNQSDAPKIAAPNPAIAAYGKPKLAAPLRLEKEDLDTNKLPPLIKSKTTETIYEKAKTAFDKITIPAKESEKEVETTEETPQIETDAAEYDDCAPLAMRFNAGLFDLIIGSFLTLLLLAPFMLLGGNWVSFGGFLAFAATCAIVMFVYMTASIGLYGKTFGMRLFALEVIDIDGENYPTLHQAAVSSSVYLLSLAFGGIGFLTLPFNEDHRAIHDLVSKTVIVREES